ncbi:MAG: CoA-acylating methylmalonate-semialdehyde dehydrogenase [Candidatus Hydrogenedentes bacterium]|nr:CoA-acylating methylmalonate-semialdehyde dehydrogenase [Candidatus Hydrogenedentota bacterium]
MSKDNALLNYINGAWKRSAASEALDVLNPATQESLGAVPMTPAQEVAEAAEAAQKAFPEWRRTPATDRVQYLFKFKMLLEDRKEELARVITEECGKTFAESLGEIRRVIENVETACGIPILMQGTNNEDIARGIDEHMIRQPLGTVAIIAPFNFPAMIPLWFLPYALATGNCAIVKPTEKCPVTQQRLFEYLDELKLPPGVVQLVNGGKETVDAILDHPAIRAISMVGSTPAAKYIYRRAAENGKRAQCQGGAKNPVVIMPDADMDMAMKILGDSAFGCAGQRCLALSSAITVGESRDIFREQFAEVAANRVVGYGMDEGVETGPVISRESKDRLEAAIARAEQEGAKVLVDGRGRKVAGYEDGNFVFPTILDAVAPQSETAKTELFGPVFSLMHADTLDEAISQVNARAYGNMACIFTTDGAAARRFRYEAYAGNIGINVGVAAPMAFFPFSGWGESFFGDLHAQSAHSVEFYTETKVVVERWPREWSRKF